MRRARYWYKPSIEGAEVTEPSTSRSIAVAVAPHLHARITKMVRVRIGCLGMSIELISVLGVVCLLLLGGIYAVAGSRISEQWWAWIRNALLAAGGVLAIGMVLLGLPGAVFVELVTGSGRKLA